MEVADELLRLHATAVKSAEIAAWWRNLPDVSDSGVRHAVSRAQVADQAYVDFVISLTVRRHGRRLPEHPGRDDGPREPERDREQRPADQQDQDVAHSAGVGQGAIR